jgi:hypothetical protein
VIFFECNNPLSSSRAHTLPYASVLFSFFLDVFSSASRGFGQDTKVVAEDRAADGRGKVVKSAKTASGQPESPF